MPIPPAIQKNCKPVIIPTFRSAIWSMARNSGTWIRMTNIETPSYLQDASQLLSEDGFKTGNCWYHGTTSGLVQAIQEQGLKGSGDAEFNKATKKTMETIGAKFAEQKEPVFLTQSKELAYYWAHQKTQTRNQRFSTNETAVVLAVTLPESLSNSVKPDVGAATMLMDDNNAYLEYLRELYASHQLTLPELNPGNIDRMMYLNLLGLAYCSDDIASDYIKLVD